MNLRLFLLLVPVLVWTCTTPAPAPPTPSTPAIPVPEIPAKPSVPDDDHRAVTREEFHKSPWEILPTVASWKAESTGVSLELADGRVLRLDFVAPAVVRWWVPAAPGEMPLSPGAVYPASGATVKVKELDGTLVLDTPGLGVRLRLADLSWVLIRGDKTVLKTVAGPRRAGRRLVQAFDARDSVRWWGPGLDPSAGAKFWIDNQTNADGTGPFAVPSLVGGGGNLPVVLALDNSYQTYTRVTADEVSLGALNGGLDLLVAAAPQAVAAVEALTSITGRPSVVPLWAHGTALALPASESGAFLRKAKLSIQVASDASPTARTRFQALAPFAAGGALPDLTVPQTRDDWLTKRGLSELLPGAGISLPAVPGRQDWNARFDDGGLGSLLARMNNRLADLEVRAVAEAWRARNPGLRPLILAGSGTWGTVRQALPEVRATAGADAAVLTQVLVGGAVGLSTPAVHLDLTPLAHPETKAAAFQSLMAWLLIPVLTLDWGSDPAGFWSALPDTDRVRLKGLLDRRSQLKPLLGQVARNAALTGRPAWQPLWFAAPTDAQALARDDQFLVGDSLLVAPVTGGERERAVYLPGPGVWFDFWTGEEFGGGRSYDVEARPDRPLWFVRGGALIPVRESEVFDDKDVYNPLTIHVFPGGRGVASYYLDDGKSTAWKGGVYWETRLTYGFSQKEMTLDHEMLNSTGLLRPDPYLLYRVHNVYKPRQVKIDGKPVPLFGDSWGITDTDRSAAWYEADHTLLIKTFRPEKDQNIVMVF